MDIAKLKCRDCMRLHPFGWWEEPTCEMSGFPVDKNGPACISILPKKAPGKSRESKTK